jgi:hypothetical protein
MALSQPHPECPFCRGTGWVCEAHTDQPSDCSSPDHPDACHCGAPGEPCWFCLPSTMELEELPIPAGFTGSIGTDERTPILTHRSTRR